jgi:glycosyltransferase involved in cell wall biosynthesis
MPRVSVVIPTCNRPELLTAALASALGQSEPDLEVLVIDDYSQDRQAEQIVHGQGDPRVTYIRQPERRGVAAARNVGVRRATAPYIAFLDDDDQWLPAKLAIQLRVLEMAPPTVAGVYTARYTVDRSSGRASTTRFHGRRFSPGQGNVITTSSLLVRRRCFDVVGLFDEQLGAASDWDMWIRIASQFEFEYIDDPLIRYTVHPKSISRDFRTVARSREMIFAKHVETFARYPRSFSQRYTALGMLYYHNREIERARRSFLNAIWYWPLALKAYFGLLVLFTIRGPLCELRNRALMGRFGRTR